MSAESDKIRESLVGQLSSFDERLDEKIDDVQMLAGIQDGIGRLLGSNGGNEADIRRVLQDRYENGNLRKETFQLVKSMLDGYVSEQAPTSSLVAAPTAPVKPQMKKTPDPESLVGDDPMSSTIVIPKDETIKPDSADGRVQVGSVLRDRFMLQERLAGGGMGVVYKAMDRRLAEADSAEPWVAVKILSPELSQNANALRALQQEASKGRCLTHPNIVRFVDLDRDDDLYFIVMEWLEGRTLADILDSADSRSIDQQRAFSIVRQIGKALDYAHRCGIVHADVKPGNIMIAPNGDAKLFDFGVARVRQKQLQNEPNFDPGVLGLFTPAYSSMQVLTGETPVPSDDVFSLACLLYRLIAGYRVFGPRNAAEAAEEGMKPQQLESINDEQWRVLKKALSYSRVTRFESMVEFIDALDVEVTESITVDVPAPARFSEAEETGGVGRLLMGLVILLAVSGMAANQMGYLDEFKARYLPVDDPAEFVETEAIESSAPAVVEEAEPLVEEVPLEEEVIEDFVDDAAVEAELAEIVEPIAIPEPEEFAEPLVDFSLLPAPSAEVSIALRSNSVASSTVTLREDGRSATVDLVRENVEFPLTLRVEEVSFSGNRSPWATNQYEFSDNGFVEFPVGQDRARITLTMTSDRVREADQQSTLRVRESENATSELALITVILEDDDQRVFEQSLPANTVAFATSQVSVREQDPAVQIDILRFNPDDTSLVVGFALRDITATKGEDYFAPSGYSITFGPGQRSARLLIPLVQDSDYEDNEAFSVELSNADSTANTDIYHRIAVMIRDDDT
jgi:serine/threonine protein kinase